MLAANAHQRLRPTLRNVGSISAIVKRTHAARQRWGADTSRQGKPMVIFYRKGSKTSYVLARSFIPTKFFTLPNLIAGERIVPEFVPHFGGPEPIIAAAKELLADPAARAAQIASLNRICSMFNGLDASLLAAEKIIEHYNLRVNRP